MTKPVNRPYKKPGRKPATIPRKQKHLYMSDACVARVQAWVLEERSKLGRRNYNFCDAVEDMTEIASFFHVDRKRAAKLAPLYIVMRDQWPWEDEFPWIRIDSNSGRLLRCIACKTEQQVEARRFSGVIKAIEAFVEAHQDCEAHGG